MGRLTEKDFKFTSDYVASKLQSWSIAQCLNKLQKYENLEEQCIKETTWSLELLLYKWKVFFNDIAELYKYRQLEEQGLLLRLPCKVGTFVWYTYYRKEPERVKVSMLQQKVDGSWKIRFTPQGGSVFDVTLENFNKYCFPTKPEAEEALRKMQEGSDD